MIFVETKVHDDGRLLQEEIADIYAILESAKPR
jgi:hypothetical protein